ncbi:MAG: hypothetical protein M3R55_14145, partial [Acidobacteriota bacterium]|nr:hypothetical protein [Acidobacteriota bacterium]
MRFLLSVLILASAAAPAAAQSAPRLYETALAREQEVRETPRPSLRAMRALVAEYEAIVHRYPVSGYSDNALWQAAGVAQHAFEKHGQGADRRTALRLLEQLRASYPTGTLAKQVPARAASLAGTPSTQRTPAAAPPTARDAAPATPAPAPV